MNPAMKRDDDCSSDDVIFMKHTIQNSFNPPNLQFAYKI